MPKPSPESQEDAKGFDIFLWGKEKVPLPKELKGSGVHSEPRAAAEHYAVFFMRSVRPTRIMFFGKKKWLREQKGSSNLFCFT